MQDRPYQETALNTTASEFDNGTRRMMHVMATGTGKTYVFGRLFETMKSRLPGQQMIFAHTDELVTQSVKTMEEMYPHLKVGREMAGSYADPDSDIVVASVATLGRKDTKRVQRFDWSHFDKFVIDEAHHSTGDGYRRVLELSGCLLPDTNKLLLGVTATPNRPDGMALDEIYEKVAFSYSLRQAIKDGWLVDLKAYTLRTTTSLAEVGHTGGDFNKSELAATVNNPVRNQQIVDFWKKYGGDRPTVAFCVDIQHAKDLAEEFVKVGVPAAAVWGDDGWREEKLQAHRDGKIKVLCNCNVLTEGYDDWRIGCIILARPTESSILFTQMVGRGTRLQRYDGKVYNLFDSIALGLDLKSDCIVLDVVDNAVRNSLITLPTLMGIQSTLDLHGRSLLEAVEEMEAAQEQCPTVDLSKLADINDLQSVVEKVNLFEVRFPQEVEQNSELTWFRAIGGGYKMLIPKETSKVGYVKIYENALGKWEIDAEINDDLLHGVRSSMEEAFKAADEQIRKRVTKQTLSKIKREATWHNKPVTSGQKKMLARLFPKRVWPFEHMTSGQASKIISERFTRRNTK